MLIYTIVSNCTMLLTVNSILYNHCNVILISYFTKVVYNHCYYTILIKYGYINSKVTYILTNNVTLITVYVS